jgi:alpha-galactosidase
MTRLVAIGIGSHIFGIELLRDVFQTPELRGSELWLVDVDPSTLAGMTALARRLNEAAGWDVRIFPTTEREEALPGADFVVTSVAVDRDRTWQVDHALALKHGFPSVDSENGGPGGLSHTLRSIPLVLSIIRDVERLAPNAVVLQYTNPENRIALAIREYTTVRSVGLCHGVAHSIGWMAGILGRGLDDIEVDAAGVNHFTWVLGVRDPSSGDDLYPEFMRTVRALPPDAEMGYADQLTLSRMCLDRFGIWPTTGDSHIGEYIGWAAEVMGTSGWPWPWATARRERARRNVELWAAGTKPVQPLLEKPSHEARINHSATGIIADMLAGRTRRRPSFILPNLGYIENVPSDVVVEVSGIIRDGTCAGLPMGRLPDAVASMVNLEIGIQKLAVRAAVEGSRELALQALLIDPCVTGLRAAEAFLDEVLDVHRRYLPMFWQS